MAFGRRYFEQVVSAGSPLCILDAAADQHWPYPEDRVRFERGVYPGYLSAA